MRLCFKISSVTKNQLMPHWMEGYLSRIQKEVNTSKAQKQIYMDSISIVLVYGIV